MILNPFVFESQSGKDEGWKRTHAVHPYLKRLQAFNEGEGMKIILERFAVHPLRRPLDFFKDVGGPLEKNEMGEFLLLRTAGKPHIHLYDVRLLSRGEKEVNAEIHLVDQK